MPKVLNFGDTATPQKKVLQITSFAGIDLSSAPADIDKKRSPDAPNMMPDNRGNPIKRTGFSLIKNYGGRINGCFFLGAQKIIHAGKKLFANEREIWDGMADEISSAQALDGKLYIFDGEHAIIYNGTEAFPLCDAAYIPTVLISKNADFAEKGTVLKGDGTSTEFYLESTPKEIKEVTVDGTSTEYTSENGKITFESAPKENAKIVIKAVFEQEPGGSTKEEFNLISERWKESFLCSTGTESVFTLSKTGLSKGKVKAWVLDEEGNWQEKTENEDFSVDREKGKITFNEPVLKTPITGNDNLIIEAEKYFPGYMDKINRCKQSITFDAGGTSTRIFVSGNPDAPEQDHWCAAGDPTYWPDTFYSNLSGEIAGYSIIGDRLATFILNPKDGRSIAIRNIYVDENGNVSFPIEKYLQGEKALAGKGFVFMDSEQLFLTARGVYALTTEDVSGEKYTQNRSYFINKVLCGESLLENAFCAKWKQFYVIAINGKLYLLDTSQKSYSRGEPLSSFQYECYLWTGIGARVLWEEKEELFFGDKEGNVCKFQNGSYHDYSKDGNKAITAYWTVPDFEGDIFWKNKTIRTVALVLAPYPQSEVFLEKCINGIWELLKEFNSKLSFFGWSGINWAEFTWSGNARPRTVTLKTKIKKFDKVGFRVGCSDIDKAFGLYGFSLEYTENGRYKK